MRRRKMIGLGLIAVTCLFVFCCMLIFMNRKSYKIEKGVSKAIQTYSPSTEPVDIKVLSKEINELVEKKFMENAIGELSEEELQELLVIVADRLQEDMKEIGDKQRYEIANQVIAQIIELGIGDTTEEQKQLEEYKKKLEQLTQETNEQFRNVMETMVKDMEKVQETIEKTNANINAQETIFNQHTQTYQQQVSVYNQSIEELQNRTKDLEDNVLFHSYEEETGTLHIFARKEEDLTE